MDIERVKELLSALSGASRRELCEYFKRTEGAIDARLVRLGKISERKGFEQI